MAMLARLYSNGRAAERRLLGADATLRGGDQAPVDVLVADLSATGCLFACAEELALGEEITIGIAGVGRRQARVVRAVGGHYGCEFAVALTEAEAAAARTDPDGTVVGFPAWSVAATLEADLPAVTRLPGPARLAIVIGGAAATWWAVLAAANLLH